MFPKAWSEKHGGDWCANNSQENSVSFERSQEIDKKNRKTAGIKILFLLFDCDIQYFGNISKFRRNKIYGQNCENCNL